MSIRPPLPPLSFLYPRLCLAAHPQPSLLLSSATVEIAKVGFRNGGSAGQRQACGAAAGPSRGQRACPCDHTASNESHWEARPTSRAAEIDGKRLGKAKAKTVDPGSCSSTPSWPTPPSKLSNRSHRRTPAFQALLSHASQTLFSSTSINWWAVRDKLPNSVVSALGPHPEARFRKAVDREDEEELWWDDVADELLFDLIGFDLASADALLLSIGTSSSAMAHHRRPPLVHPSTVYHLLSTHLFLAFGAASPLPPAGSCRSSQHASSRAMPALSSLCPSQQHYHIFFTLLVSTPARIHAHGWLRPSQVRYLLRKAVFGLTKRVSPGRLLADVVETTSLPPAVSSQLTSRSLRRLAAGVGLRGSRTSRPTAWRRQEAVRALAACLEELLERGGVGGVSLVDRQTLQQALRMAVKWGLEREAIFLVAKTYGAARKASIVWQQENELVGGPLGVLAPNERAIHRVRAQSSRGDKLITGNDVLRLLRILTISNRPWLGDRPWLASRLLESVPRQDRTRAMYAVVIEGLCFTDVHSRRLARRLRVLLRRWTDEVLSRFRPSERGLAGAFLHTPIALPLSARRALRAIDPTRPAPARSTQLMANVNYGSKLRWMKRCARTKRWHQAVRLAEELVLLQSGRRRRRVEEDGEKQYWTGTEEERARKTAIFNVLLHSVLLARPRRRLRATAGSLSSLRKVPTVYSEGLRHLSMLFRHQRPLRRRKKLYEGPRELRHVLELVRVFVSRYDFVPDRVTLNIILKAALKQERLLGTNDLKRLWTALESEGATSVVGRPSVATSSASFPSSSSSSSSNRGSSRASESILAFSLLAPAPTSSSLPCSSSSSRTHLAFKRHVRPLHLMFIDAFRKRGDQRAARKVLQNLLSEAERARGPEGERGQG